jgi:hypothetical protein
VVGLPLYFDIDRPHESRTTAVMPFIIRARDRVESSTSWVIPALATWWRTRERGPDAGTDFAWFPLVWKFGRGDHLSTVVAPFVWDFKRGESRTTVVFPVAAHWRRPDGDHTLVLNSYYRRGLGPKQGSWYFNFFPLFGVGRPAAKDVEWDILEGLVGFTRKGRNRTMRLLWVLDFSLAPAPASNVSFFGGTHASARSLDLF